MLNVPATFVAIMMEYMQHNGHTHVYRGADKSLVRPGRKQAIATEDFEFHTSYL